MDSEVVAFMDSTVLNVKDKSIEIFIYTLGLTIGAILAVFAIGFLWRKLWYVSYTGSTGNTFRLNRPASRRHAKLLKSAGFRKI
jgi:hypothetical protein